MKDRVYVFDTTLRDGDQASGFHMFGHEKRDIARQLATLGVDIIEAGFAASSAGDAESIKSIAEEIGQGGGPVICSLARAVQSDIIAAGRAIEPAKNKRIHTFIATSDGHIAGKFRKDRDWVVEQAVKSIRLAREFTDDVEFSCEDFGRSDNNYTVDVVSAAIEAGATTINLPDTVGFLMPHECFDKFRYVIEAVRGKGLDAIFSVHNHNDFGMATATSLAAIMAGARQVEVTINSIGERAGNTSLEEIVAVINERKPAEVYCGVDTSQIGPTSRLVSRITGVAPQPNKAIVGKNAFAHEAGIHQDGMIKDSSTYEIMNPKDYGMESVLTFGARSGSAALRQKYHSLEIEMDDETFATCAERFFTIADERKEIDDADVIMSACGVAMNNQYEVSHFHPMVNGEFKAFVEITSSSGRRYRNAAVGNGQIDAAFRSIQEAIGVDYHVVDFQVRSNGQGSDSSGISRIEMTNGTHCVIGRGEHTDVVSSAIEAYVDGCNRLGYISEVK